RPVRLEQLEAWYKVDLTGCRQKLIPLPFFDRFGTWIDPNAVTTADPNPFEAVAAESRAFDVFINVNMVTLIQPLSPFSLFLCHFPESVRNGYFAVDDYSCLAVNSHYTATWVRALWGLEPALVLYPPVEMTGPRLPKENIILSAARFETGGSKKQHELIRAFAELQASDRELFRDWRLVLVGGSLPENPYLERIRQLARQSQAPVEVRVNVPASELQQWYARAKIFWHACGLGETNPHLVEHFGMTTVEAMQNRCLPIVINGGGQREIVEPGESGYRFDTLAELCRYTRETIAEPGRLAEMQEKAWARAQAFTRERFQQFVRGFFQQLERDYRTLPVPDPRDILTNQRRANLFYSPVARRARALGGAR
ncbi:MAG: glycosyltransferase, partial [Acidobacteria bacterium]|nr:glycosyltransferase [Acidobacteriota bacterium]